MSFITSDLVRWSPFNLPGPVLYGYETNDSIATVSVSSYFESLNFFVTTIEFNPGDIISASCSDGSIWLTVTSVNPVVTMVGFTAVVGPNSVYTAAIQDHAVTPIKTSGLAYEGLNNLSGVAINTTLVSDTDNTDDLGTITKRWANVYASNYSTDHTAGHTFTLSGWDVDGAVSVPFLTITANNTPTAALSGSVTGVTQLSGDNSTKLATTAYADAAAGVAGANKALSNLVAVAINTTLVSDTDVTDDLGTFNIRWNNVFAANIGTDHTAGHTTTLSAWDVDGGSFTTFITLTANNTPTCALSGSVTGVTQSPADNSTKLATTAYADAAAAGGGAPTSATYITQTPNGTLSAEQALSLLATGILKSTTATGVVSIAAQGTDYYAPGGTKVSLADGGTNAGLTASNGGIFYSTSTAGAILAGTATANQALLSGASGAPSWSTATYPATTTINRILYSSANNTIGQITTANSSILVTDSGGIPSLGTALPNGITATTQTAGDSTTKVATTAFVAAATAGAGLTLGKVYPITFGGFSN